MPYNSILLVLPDIDRMVKVFIYGPRDLGSIKDSKMVLDATLLNTQHYKIRIKVK